MTIMMEQSRIDQLSNTGFENRDIRLFIKRDDLLNGPCQGNKFRKLKYHVATAQKQGKTQLLSFGGVYSNHLFALAHFGHQNEWETIGVVRGEQDSNNPSVRFMKRCGMTLISLTRTDYRRRNDPDFLFYWQGRYPHAYIIPEGGSRREGMAGIEELAVEIRNQSPVLFNHWICPFATGCTAAGLASGTPAGTTVWAFTVLKGLDYEQILRPYHLSSEARTRLEIFQAHLGGFARQSVEVELFIKEFYKKHDIILDPIYSGKMMLNLYRKLAEETDLHSLNLLVVHTGGTQGNMGYNLRFGTDLPIPDFLMEKD